MSIEFSIVVPLYNKADYVERALQSVFAQTHAPLEIIIVDDASTDNSFEVAQTQLDELHLATPEINILTLQNNRNLGPGASRNRGLEYARGDYVLFLDADDEYQRCLLQKLNHLAVDASADVVVFGYRRMPENTTMPAQIYLAAWMEKINQETYRMIDPQGFVFDRRFAIGPGSNVAVRRTLISDIRYDESVNIYEGIDFWFRVLQKLYRVGGQAYYLTGPYHTVHRVPGSLIRKCLGFNEIEYPRALGRYAQSGDVYERQLRRRVAKIWFKDCLSRLHSSVDKLKFIWRYRRDFYFLFSAERYPEKLLRDIHSQQ